MTTKSSYHTKHGQIIPVADVVYNPTHEWVSIVYRFHNILDKDREYQEPHYGGSKIDAVLLEGGDLAKPGTQTAILYKAIYWPNDTTVLRVFELENGTLWEAMTDSAPCSLDPGQSIIRGRDWQDDWYLQNKAKKCADLIGHHVYRFYFLKRMSDIGLRLHESRVLSKR